MAGQPKSKRQCQELWYTLNTDLKKLLRYHPPTLTDIADLIDLLQLGTSCVVKFKGNLLGESDSIPETSKETPLVLLTTVEFWFRMNRRTISCSVSPDKTIARSIRDTLNLPFLETSKYMVHHRQNFISQFDFGIHVHTLHTTVTDYLELLDRIDVKVKIHQYLGEMTLDIAAPSTVRNLLTEVSKKLPGKIASGDLIIKHGDKTPRIDQYVVDFSLQEPFHICYKEMSREEKVYAMQAIIHPPSQHGGDIVDKHSAAAEFKGIQVFCHRENKHGNHASLYYPGFAEFTSMCKSVALTKEDCTFTSKLCACMSKYYDNEAARQKKCNELFSAYFGKAVAPKSIHNPPKSCICDGAIEAVLYIEYKLEVGRGNCDSYTEVIAYYIEDLLSGNLSSSCRPSFLVEIVGPHMFVSGAVFADTVHVDRLTPPVWLVVQPLDEVEMIRTAKTLKALKTACIALERSVACPQPRFPAFCQFDENTLEYLEQIGLHLFKCIVKPSNVKCVVKFALRYCKEAHALLANAGYAPRLLHVGMSSNFHVVVMEDVEGALTVDNYIAKNEGDRDDILEKCRKALCTLHSKGYCHGDFRPCNILVSLTKEVKVIDFDWAGKVNVAVYPFFMNHQSITWPGGAEDGAHLSKEHDMYWLAKMEQN